MIITLANQLSYDPWHKLPSRRPVDFFVLGRRVCVAILLPLILWVTLTVSLVNLALFP